MKEDRGDRQSRTATWVDPRSARRLSQEMTPLQHLEAMINGRLPSAPMSELMDFKLVDAGDGFAIFACVPGVHHFNPLATVHGGLAATLIDSATGCAISTRVPAGASWTTVNLSVDYFRTMTEKTGPIRCEARVVKSGRRISVADAEVVGEDGTVYARGSATYMIILP